MDKTGCRLAVKKSKGQLQEGLQGEAPRRQAGHRGVLELTNCILTGIDALFFFFHVHIILDCYLFWSMELDLLDLEHVQPQDHATELLDLLNEQDLEPAAICSTWSWSWSWRCPRRLEAICSRALARKPLRTGGGLALARPPLAQGGLLAQDDERDLLGKMGGDLLGGCSGGGDGGGGGGGDGGGSGSGRRSGRIQN